MFNQRAPRLTLTPILSRKRERGRAATFIGGAERYAAPAADTVLPLAGEGGAIGRPKDGLWRRMRVSHGAGCLRADCACAV
jgi:hypothetical protein